jgi:hypothetical protein
VRIAVLVFALVNVTACADPCRDLAEVVCSCEANRSRELSCLNEMNAAREQNEATEEETHRCEAILAAQSCSCDALNLGERNACGLAEDPVAAR